MFFCSWDIQMLENFNEVLEEHCLKKTQYGLNLKGYNTAILVFE